MWNTEDLREDVEQMFEVLSGVFIEPPTGFSSRKPNPNWTAPVLCAGCGAHVNTQIVRSGKQWCSNKCKQRAKYKANPWWKKPGAQERQAAQRKKRSGK